MSYHFALFPFIKPYIEKKRQRNASCFTYHRGGTQENLRLSCAAAEPALERGVQAIHLLASMYLYRLEHERSSMTVYARSRRTTNETKRHTAFMPE